MTKFALPSKTETLEFDSGLKAEVVVSPVPLGPYLDLVGIMEDEERRRSSEGIRALAEGFAPFIASWNLDAPATPEGVMTVDFNVVLGLVIAWVRLVGEVPLPLPSPSSGTSTRG